MAVVTRGSKFLPCCFQHWPPVPRGIIRLSRYLVFVVDHLSSECISCALGRVETALLLLWLTTQLLYDHPGLLHEVATTAVAIRGMSDHRPYHPPQHVVADCAYRLPLWFNIPRRREPVACDCQKNHHVRERPV